MRRLFLTLTLAGLVAMAGAVSASADAVYHSEHLGLSPVGDAPLRSIAFHEFLHLCGDASRNGAIDGTLRHNLAGADAIAARLSRP